MRIVHLTATAIDIPLRTPFGIAGGVQDIARNVLVAIDLDDGTRGYGEAAPLPAFNGETQAMALAALEEARSAVIGADARAWRRTARELHHVAPNSASARCAIETAILDALTRRAGISLHTFFGGAETKLVTDITIPIGTVEQASREANAWVNFSRFKVKVGGADDRARLAAIHGMATAA